LGIQRALVAWHRIQEVLEFPEDSYEGKTIKKINKIMIDNVSFAFDSNVIFNNLTLSIQKGKTIGIIGESGNGKTTLVKLLLGVLNIQKGEISINNFNIDQINMLAYRSRVGYVSQEPLLFNDSIYNNISIGDKNASNNDIIHAAKLANIHDFIVTLPDGYQSVIKQLSDNISIGQKQRIAIARMILKDPDVLILDEPTSSIDMESEEKIIDSIKTIKNNKIVIIVTHSWKILDICDDVYELKNGNLILIKNQLNTVI
jgi:ABC-type bacteriocin/lantibiotic exporter with double-glycine peptidase domain